MTTIRVFHDADRGAIFVSMVNAAFPSRTLIAARSDDIITLRICNSDQMLVAAPWSDYARQDGSKFADVDEAFAYVSDACNRAPARMPTVLASAGEDITTGMPLAISRANGTLRLARADSYPLAFVAGLAAETAAATFPARGVRTYVTQADWTAVAGTPLLTPSVPYFLAPEGGITLTPGLAPGLCCVRVGEASGPTTLMFHPADPVLL